MLRKYLSATVLASAFFTAGPTAYAGQPMNGSTGSQMPHFVAHQRSMKYDTQTDSPAKLGVAIAAIAQADLDAMSIEYGVEIMEVRVGSVADDAGLKAGDVITYIDGRPAYSPQRLQHLVREASGASTIELIRNGEPLQLQAEYASAGPADTSAKAVLGVRIQDMTPDLKEAFGTSGEQGVLISQVISDSAARQAGLKAGDVVVAIGDDSITTVSDVHRTLGKYKPGDALSVSVLRDRLEESVQAVLGSARPDTSQSKAMQKHGYYHHGFHGPQRMLPGKGCAMGKQQKRS